MGAGIRDIKLLIVGKWHSDKNAHQAIFDFNSDIHEARIQLRDSNGTDAFDGKYEISLLEYNSEINDFVYYIEASSPHNKFYFRIDIINEHKLVLTELKNMKPVGDKVIYVRKPYKAVDDN